MSLQEYWGVVERVVSSRNRRPVRYSYFEDVWRAVDEGHRLVVVRAPTGCGKTEAATAPFISDAAKGSRRWVSLVYALPTRSLASAMLRRLSRSLAAAGAEWTTATLSYGGLWEARPYLEGDVAVTTYDTLLHQFYGVVSPGYHLLLPAAKVSGSLVVLDETHLLQDAHWYAPSLLPAHVASLVSLGAQVLVVGATVPEVLLEELRREYRLVSRGEEPAVVDAADEPARGRLDVELRGGGMPVEGLCSLLEGAPRPALVVVNKVEKAVEAYRALRSCLGGSVALLHSRLRGGVRARVEGLFEGDGAPGDLVLVATQVVEAGLDLDVRFLVTEVSPVDSLIQRLGRCARRSDGHAVVFLDEEAARNVYPRELVERTLGVVDAQSLAESVRRLSVARELVDGVYAAEVVERLRKGWERALSEVKGWALRFPRSLLHKEAHREPGPLLRLGYEVACYLPGSAGEYEALLGGGETAVSLERLRDYTVRLSVEGRGEAPAAVVHEVGGREVVVALEYKRVDGGLALRGRRMEPRAFPRAVESGELFLLNPAFYLSEGGDELGVVRPWRSRSA
ncbi:CRISPR-associated helicase Cas3' [Thermofilum pendens]|uniref:CRISPR-associated helicase Cas3 n=1 Tax=Thermofilum pendens (strain DSM 2475 / Hrk 5) TaxID=368408 RepID=A1RZX1_THEPD|nr:CRISPR-associated helicase Cas3' [Thermofilum pendens]ABL78751.1 CRISPR-associated helicase Cas3 [Thermofilum pendens Hrk 5]